MVSPKGSRPLGRLLPLLIHRHPLDPRGQSGRERSRPRPGRPPQQTPTAWQCREDVCAQLHAAPKMNGVLTSASVSTWFSDASLVRRGPEKGRHMSFKSLGVEGREAGDGGSQAEGTRPAADPQGTGWMEAAWGFAGAHPALLPPGSPCVLAQVPPNRDSRSPGEKRPPLPMLLLPRKFLVESVELRQAFSVAANSRSAGLSESHPSALFLA